MMSRSVKFVIAILLAISSVALITALANTIYLPVVIQDYPTATQTLTPTATATSTRTPTPTKTPTPSGVYIKEFHPDSTPSQDYVVIKNNGSGTVDLTGWFIKADKAEPNTPSRYYFPDNFDLRSGDSVNVRSGIGTDSSSNLYWGLNYPIWEKYSNNCAYLRDDSDGDNLLVDSRCVDD
jgi:hypothetical protein